MLDTYSARVDYMKKVLNFFSDKEFDYISFGGGYMGEIPTEMKGEFSFEPPFILPDVPVVSLNQNKYKCKIVCQTVESVFSRLIE